MKTMRLRLKNDEGQFKDVLVDSPRLSWIHRDWWMIAEVFVPERGEWETRVCKTRWIVGTID